MAFYLGDTGLGPAAKAPPQTFYLGETELGSKRPSCSRMAKRSVMPAM
jgi:hypothetical protein